jgi:hypothetical protein
MFAESRQSVVVSLAMIIPLKRRPSAEFLGSISGALFSG